MDGSLVASLASSLRRVPPAAVPAMLDCLLVSSNSSPCSLFSSLLTYFPNVTQDIIQANEKLSDELCSYVISFVAALSHLLKKSVNNLGGLQLFIWEVLIPLMKLVHAYGHEILDQATSLFYGVVMQTDSWEVVEVSMVPFFLRSIGLSMGMVQSENAAIYRWSAHPVLRGFPDHTADREFCQGSSNQLSYLSMDNNSLLPSSDCLPLSMSCKILASTLITSLHSKHVTEATHGLALENRHFVEIFAHNLLWDLCNMSLQMLLQSREHRCSAISFLLPSIFGASVSEHAFEVHVHGETYWFSRKHFLKKIWECCRVLFSLGSSERRDAYSILSLYFSSFSSADGFEDGNACREGEAFDLKTDNEFWDEAKKGLVDEEGSVRKQSLHILKRLIHLNEDIKSNCSDPGTISDKNSSGPCGLTKRGRWANKEAKSLGVGRIINPNNVCLNTEQKWGAFFLLYEMLEEYGTHLVEAAWNYQVALLLNSSVPCDSNINSVRPRLHLDHMETLSGTFKWLAVLWERGFCHDNPHVRCLIMDSFLGIEWKHYRNCASLVSEHFVLGPLLDGLNDPVHHKDFGLRGVYSSKTIDGAANFFCEYTSSLNPRKGTEFVGNLASFARKHPLGRAGLMALVECVASAASGFQTSTCKIECYKDDASWEIQTKLPSESFSQNDKGTFLDNLRFIIESSKQHFNPNYRRQVCEKIVDAAALMFSVVDVPIETLLHFISAIPRDFSDNTGSLKLKLQEWLSKIDFNTHCRNSKLQILASLNNFPLSFIINHNSESDFATYDDEDIDAWASEVRRWARVLFLVINEEQDLDPILMFMQKHGNDVCKSKRVLGWEPLKLLILILILAQEIQLMQERTFNGIMKARTKANLSSPDNHLNFIDVSVVFEKFYKSYLLILEELMSFSSLSCSILWSNVTMDTEVLPGSIRGKLGGPSQRRLSSSANTAVLQAITSLRTVAIISSLSRKFRSDVSLDSAITILWKLSLRIISLPVYDSETEAEIHVAAYESLAHVLNAIVPVFSPLALDAVVECRKSLTDKVVGKSLLDSLIVTFIQNINDLTAVRNLARTRRAILLKWKWICLESLLSIPKHSLANGVHIETSHGFVSYCTIRWIFNDVVDSLEKAGEDSVLPILRSVRLIFEIVFSSKMDLVTNSCDTIDAKMMWQLVRSAWILHTSCNKRRVAPIAALLSSVLHYSIFGDESMHQFDNASGPLKWFIGKILEEGTKSPRTIRLAALHLTGLWLRYPSIIKYYMNELKLLTMYGSVAFDEDFEAELADNHDAMSEILVLAKSPDNELTQEFINTELYARVSVSVLFYKLSCLADTLGSVEETITRQSATQSGKMFLLELLSSVVYDKDLSKELYKKYSAIHRRKVRAWQMICILACFVDEDIIQEVTSNLYTSLDRNNLPGVRQYMETVLIHIYLKFPLLVGHELVPILRNYDMRPQALSSYVFVAANVILHSTKAVQLKHLDDLLPPIVPFLTSHHHTLRGFTQLLVYNVLKKLLPSCEDCIVGMLSLEKRCLEDLKFYLSDNSDCARLRVSMEGYLDAFNPKQSITPTGIFSNRIEDIEFECVPTSLMERVIFFLDGAREDLRCSMAKDVETLKSEKMKINEDLKCIGRSEVADEIELPAQLPENISLDFQRKITLSKPGYQGIGSNYFLGNKDIYRSVLDMEKEDQLIDRLLHTRVVAMEESRAKRQPFIFLASFLDRIPNLAGLARTCEVFKAAALAVADKSILQDKQFQLISVTAEKWVPVLEVPVSGVKIFLEKMKREGFSILGLEQTANSIPLDQYIFPKKTVMVLGREKEGIPVEIIHILDACIEIPQLGVVRSLNVHVSGAIALWEYTRQQRSH